MAPYAGQRHKDGEDEQHPIRCFASEYDGFASRSNQTALSSLAGDSLHTASLEPCPSWKQTPDIESASTACSTQDSLPSLTIQDSLPSLTVTRLLAHERQTTERTIPAIAKPARWYTIHNGQPSFGHRWPFRCFDENMEDASDRATERDPDDDVAIDSDDVVRLRTLRM